MGIYTQSSISDLATMRARLLASLQDRLTNPTAASGNGRNVQYQQSVPEIRREIAAIDAETSRRAGAKRSGPIYLV